MTSITPQATPFTLCVVCSDSQEFDSHPTKSSEITMPCWNPSGSKSVTTDTNSMNNPKKFCKPNNGFCKTETWQYSTRSPLKTTSFWVGIERGCQPNQDGSTSELISRNLEGSGLNYSGARGVDGMTKFVRYYLASNTAGKVSRNTVKLQNLKTIMQVSN